MKYNPAIRLEQLEREIFDTQKKVAHLKANGYDYSEQVALLKTLDKEYAMEFDKVHKEYCQLFEDFYFTTKDIQTMLDLDIQMVVKHIAHEVEHVQFSKTIRRHIKSCRKFNTYDKLEQLLYKKGIDIDKKIFFSRASLIKWLTTHVTTYNKIPIDIWLASKMIEDRSRASVLNTVHYMERAGLKYDAQLQRKNVERLYFYMQDNNTRVLSRIPVDRSWESLIVKLREL